MKNNPIVGLNGSKKWYLKGQHHREDGPAVEYANGSKYWYLNDQRHREDGPAVENANGSKEWYLNDQLHREDGPAVEYTDGNKSWYLKGQLHREDGPAVEYTDGNKSWYLKGQRHREDGPAVEYADGSKEWYLNGNEITEEEFNTLQGINKTAYFLGEGGTNEPTSKKYKSDKAIVVQPSFEGALYRNYDLYDTPGEHSLGAGYHSLQNYKSIFEFLKAKRKNNKNKYKADDSWIEDDGSITKDKKVKARTNILSKLLKNAIDFPMDQYIDPGIAIGDQENLMSSVNPMGGYLDKYLPLDDFEGKPPTALNFGRDYVKDEHPTKNHIKLDDIEKLLNQYLSHGLYGLPNGVDLPEEDIMESPNSNPYYGTLGPNSLIYEDKWNI